MTNAYWNAVKDHINPTGSLWRTPEVYGYGPGEPSRHELTKQYSWTITDPSVVSFVVQQAGPRVVDPMAGTGWWAYLLGQFGCDVVASDKAPAANQWCGPALHVPVAEVDGAEAVTAHADRTLLLSWPPYDDPAGARIVRAYGGDRIVYIGEGDGGCCGDDDLHALLAKEWTEVASFVPVQWFGMHDVVTVYTRGGGA
jgi:hypothetical protein